MVAIKDPVTATSVLTGLVREHPLPALTVGLALGLLAGVALPATRRDGTPPRL